MSDKIDIAAFERDRDQNNAEVERLKRETEWKAQFQQKLKAEEKLKAEAAAVEAMKAAKPTWQEDLKPILSSVVTPKTQVVSATRSQPVSQQVSENSPKLENKNWIQLELCDGSIAVVLGYIIPPPE